MNIKCLIKYVTNTNNIEYDYEKERFIKKENELIINPEDNIALEWCLVLKDNNPLINIEVITMASEVIKEKTYDLIRKGVDKVTIISDKKYRSSDSYATSLILSTYLQKTDYGLIICGNHAIDGATGHVGIQVATFLDIDQFSCVKQLSYEDNNLNMILDYEGKLIELQTSNRCLLSCTKEVAKRARFVKYKDKDLDVSQKVFIINDQKLKVDINKIGLKGSYTYVKKITSNKIKEKENKTLDLDQGVDYVFNILKKENLLK